MRTTIIRLAIFSGVILLLAAACSLKEANHTDNALTEEGPVLKVFYPAN